MSTTAYTLSTVEVTYFSLMMLPTLFLTKVYWKPFTLGWPLLVIFLALQITGAAIALKNGKDGPISVTGTIISGVGVSPQLLGILGITHQLANLLGTLDTNQIRKRVDIASTIFHIGVITAVPIYAIGQSGKAQRPPKENAASLSKAGIVLLLILWLFAAMATTWYSIRMLRAQKERTTRYRALFLAVICSMALLGIRILYQTIATLTNDPKYSAIGGNAVYAGCLQFLPSALVVLVLVLGGLLSSKGHNEPVRHGDSETRC